MIDFDVHIKGGTIVDGTRVPRFRGDLWIKDGRIAQIGGRAQGVADRIIDDIRSRERNGIVELPERQLRPGDRVRILAGPFQGELALYQSMRPRERIEVLLQLLGRQSRIVLRCGDVEPVRT